MQILHPCPRHTRIKHSGTNGIIGGYKARQETPMITTTTYTFNTSTRLKKIVRGWGIYSDVYSWKPKQSFHKLKNGFSELKEPVCKVHMDRGYRATLMMVPETLLLRLGLLTSRLSIPRVIPGKIPIQPQCYTPKSDWFVCFVRQNFRTHRLNWPWAHGDQPASVFQALGLKVWAMPSSILRMGLNK